MPEPALTRSQSKRPSTVIQRSGEDLTQTPDSMLLLFSLSARPDGKTALDRSSLLPNSCEPWLTHAWSGCNTEQSSLAL